MTEPRGEFRLIELEPPSAGLRAAPDERLPTFLGTTATGKETARRLRSVKAAVLGVGAVGRSIALHLARLGVAWLGLVDPRCYKPESLLTQPGCLKSRTTCRSSER